MLTSLPFLPIDNAFSFFYLPLLDKTASFGRSNQGK
ncbi:hypothetical protein A2U01_0088244, partial [Trifolium medium]|nr:hypothetical protein [Trifolium medium]